MDSSSQVRWHSRLYCWVKLSTWVAMEVGVEVAVEQAEGTLMPEPLRSELLFAVHAAAFVTELALTQQVLEVAVAGVVSAVSVVGEGTIKAGGLENNELNPLT